LAIVANVAVDAAGVRFRRGRRGRGVTGEHAEPLGKGTALA
jgi:hypothetical protein